MICDLESTGVVFREMRCERCSGKALVATTRTTSCPKGHGDRCLYEPTGLVLYEMRCQRQECRQVVTSKYADPALRQHPCKAGGTDKSLSSARKVWSLTDATAKWIAAGSPVRSAQEIAANYGICVACPRFKPHASDPDKGSCGECGCRLRKAGGLLNKIRMATERCPLDKW